MKRRIQIGDRAFEMSADDHYLAHMPERFEPQMVELFRGLVQPGDVVADVGANIGMTALLFSQPARQVLAFEPAPSTLGFLKTNVEAAAARGRIRSIAREG